MEIHPIYFVNVFYRSYCEEFIHENDRSLFGDVSQMFSTLKPQISTIDCKLTFSLKLRIPPTTDEQNLL